MITVPGLVAYKQPFSTNFSKDVVERPLMVTLNQLKHLVGKGKASNTYRVLFHKFIATPNNLAQNVWNFQKKSFFKRKIGKKNLLTLREG